MRSLRTRLGMTQAELAGADYTDSCISLIECGKRTPSRQTLETLARKLGCSVRYLEHGVSEEALVHLAEQERTARAALDRGETREAVERFASIVRSPFSRASGDLHLAALRGLAESLEACGRVDDAITEWRRAAAAGRGAGREAWASIQAGLLRCMRRRGDLDEAVELGERALAVLRSEGGEGTEAWFRIALALSEAYELRGDQTNQRRLATEFIRMAGKRGSVPTRLAACVQAAALAEVVGEHGVAVDMAEGGLSILRDGAAVERLEPAAVLDWARLLLVVNRSDQAERARTLLQGLDCRLASAGGNDRERGSCLVELARAELTLNRPQKAIACARRALGLLEHVRAGSVAEALAVIGQACARLGEAVEAVEAFTRCATLLERSGHQRRAARAWCAVAEVAGPAGAGHRQLSAAYQRALALAGLMPAATAFLDRSPSPPRATFRRSGNLIEE